MNKQEALELLNNLPDDADVELTVNANPPYVSAGYAISHFNISRQLLSYYVGQGYIRVVPRGKQKRYLLEDIKKLIK